MATDACSSKMMALEFKSTTLTVPVLLLVSNDLTDIDHQLQEKVAQAPEFFKSSPLIIDFQKLTSQNTALSVQEIVDLIRQHGFMPIGIRGGDESQNKEASALSLPVYATHSQNTPPADKKPEKIMPAKEADNTPPENRLICQPIRSGQRVYARGDLIVTATVSAGAEIMAEGNIHIYGSLRGRALAGVLGNGECRIFCSDLQAELISIAGIYQIRDDLSSYPAHKPVQISLDNQTLIIKDI
ncbi:MAG: septum site-determining protein MinC [Methylococcales bacterium]|nr:septum site-determining protein MinC [Methylococcales bacterium]